MSIVTKIRDAITRDAEKKKSEKALEKQLEETFPSSDPLGVTNPNYEITGPEVAPRKDAPPIRVVRPKD